MVPVVSLEMIFPGYDTVNKIKEISNAGFQHIEFAGWREKDISGIRGICESLGIRIVNISGHRRGSIVCPDEHPLFLQDLNETLEIAAQLKPEYLMFLTNALTAEGRVIDSYADIPAEDKVRHSVAALKAAMDIIPEEYTVVLEPLNTLVDHKGYFLDTPEETVRILNRLDDKRCRMLCDLYHFGVMGYDLEKLISDYTARFAYIHVANFPGRHELKADSNYWTSVLKQLNRCGYNGYIGFEYIPERDSVESLRRISDFWRRFSDSQV